MALTDSQLLVERALLNERARIVQRIAILSDPDIPANLADLTQKLAEIDALLVDLDPIIKKQL